MWQLRKVWEVRDQPMAKTEQEKQMGKDTGKWLVDLCLMPDPGEGRGALKKDPSSILYHNKLKYIILIYTSLINKPNIPAGKKEH